ncbi:MAG: hypothetical protein HFE49_08745 [Clostridia bacterium]|nr:hypothetical protein [Clostridia bacterium]
MNTELFKEIKATVTKKTEEELTKHSEHLKISVGEVIDMLVSGTSVEDPEKAVDLIRDYISLITNTQNDEQLERTLFAILGFCFNAVIETKKYSFEEAFGAMIANSEAFKKYISKNK